MKKSLIALALVSAFAVPAFAEEAAPAAEAPALTGNVGLFSSYRFRGIDQTMGKPALQGGFDYAHSSGLYVGNWNSNVSSYAGYPGGNLEMDFYGGYKMAFGDFGLDVGGLYYYYPGTDGAAGGFKSGVVHNGEVYVGTSWKFLTLKASYAVTDYFNAANTKGTYYIDLGAAYDLGDGWGVNGHVGYLDLAHSTTGDYADWKLGVTKDVGGYVFGLSYIGTDADKTAYNWVNVAKGSQNFYAGKNTAVLSVSKTF
ncbi:TorF family putative porin [Dechloromonas sp. HYN0024]|uniref:TorF family putative porin n=1 Tax=Dechloromonas sp. HYN0024 TaxID=2231055 RepID=UPI000E440AA9|nr:TorF family putative porin [Dechloromonas sp. HYN0024]AXS78614.1 hypothetical protein HYN24_00315 [Dechloromonas sp. HYN0024]